MDAVRKAYNQICTQWYEFRRKCSVNACIAEFAKLLKPGSKILDIGCGTGYPVAAWLDGHGFEVTGIDISEKMIEKAKTLSLIHACFFVQDFLDLKTEEKFDAVIAFDSLWHIEYSRQRELYGRVAALMNPGGFFLFTHGKRDGEVTGIMYETEFYYSALDRAEVHRLLGESGLEILSSIEDYEEASTGDRELLIIARKRA